MITQGATEYLAMLAINFANIYSMLVCICLQFWLGLGRVWHVAEARGMLLMKETVTWFPSTSGVSLLNWMKNSAFGRGHHESLILSGKLY